MSAAADEIEKRCAQAREALRDTPLRQPPTPSLIAAAVEAAREARRAGHALLAVETLDVLVRRAPEQAAAWALLGFAYADEQRIPEAAGAFARAAALDPHEPMTALAHAQAALDAGFPAVEHFVHAHELAPDDLTAVHGWAAALSSQGETAAAEALLEDALARRPDWLAGHKSLAALRYSGGNTADFPRSYERACIQQPRNLPLRLAWFSALAQARNWDEALRIVGEGERLVGAAPAFVAARAFIAGESGDRDRAEKLFAQAAAIPDDVLRLAHLRHCLRTARIDEAETLALDLMQGPSAAGVWSYLSLIWRLRGDPRAQWLDGAPPYIRAFDLDCSADELAALASVLRRLHTARGPFAEQSVRGGTQTDPDRQLFYRAEPEIQKIRAKVCAAIREYVSGLPKVPAHPLLGVPRTRISFSGSWSVRLTGRGFHVSHTHPMGWISSALYIAVPAAAGAECAGWISFGAPPAGLGLEVPAYARFEPKPGRLMLFPSTMWHETLPFEEGERLVIAFDVTRPRRPA